MLLSNWAKVQTPWNSSSSRKQINLSQHIIVIFQWVIDQPAQRINNGFVDRFNVEDITKRKVKIFHQEVYIFEKLPYFARWATFSSNPQLFLVWILWNTSRMCHFQFSSWLCHRICWSDHQCWFARKLWKLESWTHRRSWDNFVSR